MSRTCGCRGGAGARRCRRVGDDVRGRRRRSTARHLGASSAKMRWTVMNAAEGGSGASSGTKPPRRVTSVGWSWWSSSRTRRVAQSPRRASGAGAAGRPAAIRTAAPTARSPGDLRDGRGTPRGRPPRARRAPRARSRRAARVCNHELAQHRRAVAAEPPQLTTLALGSRRRRRRRCRCGGRRSGRVLRPLSPDAPPGSVGAAVLSIMGCSSGSRWIQKIMLGQVGDGGQRWWHPSRSDRDTRTEIACFGW